MDIMVDGYIAQTLTPFCTEKYLNIFISCLDNQRGSLFVFNNQWIVARPTTTGMQEQQQRWAMATTAGARAPMSPFVNSDYAAADTVYEIFDRKVDLCVGTIVPQPSAIGVTKKTGVLSPVFFIQRNGTLGIPYEFPFSERYALHNATALAPTILKRGNQNVRIRLQVSIASISSHPISSPTKRATSLQKRVGVYVYIRFVNVRSFFLSCSGLGISSSNMSLEYRIRGSVNMCP